MMKIPGPKVLIVAANASSKFGGEAFLPLKYFQVLQSRGHKVKLITHARNRDDLRQTLGPYMEDILFIEDTFWHRLVWNTGRLLPGRVAENLTRILLETIDNIYQGRPIRKLIADGHVDLIHQPIPVSPLSPSGMHKFGKPLVIGPMNGNMTYPEGYRDYESARERVTVGLARKLAPLVHRLAPGKRLAKTLLVANQRTRDALGFLDHANIVELVENGVDRQLFPGRPAGAARNEPGLRLVYMGRLPRLKALDMTLKAVAKAVANGQDVRFDIMGDGAERLELENLAGELGLGERVRFHGFLPQDRCAEILRQSDALILNSLCECGGAVVLEAMSVGLPVIAADWGGPADYVDDSCGILVHPLPRRSFVDRLSDAIHLLATDVELRRRMGDAGVEKIRTQFDWEKKVDTMLDIYADAVNR